ncbi:F-box/FBD/LRR-repeat protein At1g78750-like [Lotus japonicus]|uniref:F-box/FBD/LRR-repeat protein At1g78750-like n=1 Tax=Lotus japonicus TaxID=34305 RepID=UPI00258B3906|nr:F-box/FBD/LRR-repeat protein At1g78750-like [Lotus japonicus]
MLKKATKRGRRHGVSENEIEENNSDKLSDLPDCILLYILSFLAAKSAVQTCMLSTRWKNLWKQLPGLILHPQDNFSTYKKFTKFLSRLLTLRDGSAALHELRFWRGRPIQTQLLKRMVKYVVSHNIQKLHLFVLCDIQDFPRCIFSSQTLTSLQLGVHSKGFTSEKMSLPKSLNLPALTGLYLENFSFSGNDIDRRRVEPFSALIKLNTLMIHNCTLSDDANILCISSKSLCHLTVIEYSMVLYQIELSSPSLRAFAFEGIPSMPHIGSNLSSIEQVNINAAIWSVNQGIFQSEKWGTFHSASFAIFSWLLKLSNIKSLTITTSTLQVLSLFPLLSEVKPPILNTLESLKIIQVQFSYGLPTTLRGESGLIPIPDGIVDFLLRNSPSAKVDIIPPR